MSEDKKNKATETKAKKEAADKANSETEAKAEAEKNTQTESEAKNNADLKAEGEKADQTPPPAEKKPAKTAAVGGSACLKTVSAWINEKRLASWQSAALLRANGWADDKQVTEADFVKALGTAMNRKQGGNSGRRN